MNVILVVSSCVIISIIFLVKYYSQKKSQKLILEQMSKKISSENLFNSMRKVSFENKMDKDVTLSLKFIFSEEEPYMQEHFIPAKEQGWVPFFVPGVLHVESNNKKLIIDISKEKQEYKITIDQNGSLSNEKQIES